MAHFLGAWLFSIALVGGSLQIRALDGTILHPLEPSGVANVLFFIATDCPVANSYAPEIQRICGAYASRGVNCALVYEDASVTASEARKHLDEYHYRGLSAAIDADGALAAAVRATVTPQAVVVDRRGTVRYSGRIDNFYTALGRTRQVVTSHDLDDALKAIAAGKPVATPETPTIGCYIVPSDLRRK
jgi:hypothetical protein